MNLVFGGSVSTCYQNLVANIVAAIVAAGAEILQDWALLLELPIGLGQALQSLVDALVLGALGLPDLLPCVQLRHHDRRVRLLLLEFLDQVEERGVALPHHCLGKKPTQLQDLWDRVERVPDRY